MDNQKFIRSQEANEVLSKMPSGILRWGTGVLSIVVITLLLISYIVKYTSTTTGAATFHCKNDRVINVKPNSPLDINEIKNGQTVLLEFTNLQNTNASIIEGSISNVASSSMDSLHSFDFDVVLSNNPANRSLYIPVESNLKGTYKIITGQKRLLLKFLGK